MHFENKFPSNKATGVLIGAISMLALAWCLETEANPEFKTLYVFIFSSFISLVGAALALTGVLTNLDVQRRITHEALKRKTESARVFLPNTLSQFGAVARRGIRHS
jgi:hypothetical protein